MHAELQVMLLIYIIGSPTLIGPEMVPLFSGGGLHTTHVPLSGIQLAVKSTDAAHVCRKRDRKGRGQDSDEAYTDDEAISESDSDEDHLPAVSAQEASADDLSSGKIKLAMLLQSLLLRADSSTARQIIGDNGMSSCCFCSVVGLVWSLRPCCQEGMYHRCSPPAVMIVFHCSQQCCMPPLLLRQWYTTDSTDWWRVGPSPMRDSSEEHDLRRDSDRHDDDDKALTPDVVSRNMCQPADCAKEIQTARSKSALCLWPKLLQSICRTPGSM